MKNLIVTVALSLLIFGQVRSQVNSNGEKIDYSFEYNDPSNVAKLLVLVEPLAFDGSLGLFAMDANIGAIGRYSISEKIDVQAKFRASYFSLNGDEYRQNVEIEGMGSYFLTDKLSSKKERVEVSSTQRGNMIETKFFDTDLPQRNFFGLNAGVSFKTVGVDPSDFEGYVGGRNNLNYSTLSLIGGFQFKRINATVIKLARYPKRPIFDNYVVMSFDGIFSPVNTFSDGITGDQIGAEVKDDGLTALPFGGRFTYSIYGSIPAYPDKAKSFRYTVSSSIGYRPYLGFHFDFGIGFMVLRKK